MPRAETENDRKNQTEIADIVCAANPSRYDGYVWLSPYNYKLDGCLWKTHEFGFHVPKLFFEAKQRDYPFGHWKSGYRIAVAKLIAARWLSDATGLRASLFARFNDGVVAGVLLTDHDNRFLVAGRTDRDPIDFPHDVEPCVSVAWDRFKVIHDPARGP